MSIQEAIAAYETGELYWPISLLNELEEQKEGLGFDWVAAVAVAFFDQNEVENRVKLIQWVNETIAAKQKRDLSDLREKSLEIWNTRRDQLHISASHLCAALVHLLEGDYREYRKTIFFAISAMSEAPGFSQKGLHILTELFYTIQTDPNHSV
jgi:hypothetical protein